MPARHFVVTVSMDVGILAYFVQAIIFPHFYIILVNAQKFLSNAAFVYFPSNLYGLL
jgi:hypothetical protein